MRVNKNCTINKVIEKIFQLINLRLLSALLLNLFFLYSVANAATYYVKHATGNDNNAGISPSLPWAHCPGMYDWTGSAKLTSGDIVYFDNTSEWTQSVTNVGFMKTITPGITYDGSTWGSGTRAKFIASADYDYYQGIITILHSNTTVKGIEMTGGVFDTGYHNVSGITVNRSSNVSSISNIEIDNCIVHDTGHTDVNHNYRYGIEVQGGNGGYTDDVRILNCKVYHTQHEGIALYPDNSPSANHIANIVVRNCEVYDTGTTNRSFGFGILVKNWVTNATIEYNNLHDNRECGIGTDYGNESPSGHGATGIVIRNNIIRDNWNAGFSFMPQNDTVGYWELDFYSNLLINNGKSPCIQTAGIRMGKNASTCKVNIYNNTIYSVNVTSSDPYGVIVDTNSSGTPTINFKNNIIYTDTHIPLADTKNWFTHSNNLYFRTQGASSTHVYNGTTNYNRTGVLTYEISAKNTDPMFKNTADLPTGFVGTYGINILPNADGLSISAGDAIGNGVTLSSLYNTAINFSGKPGLTRPQGLWDIGAYQFITAGYSTPEPVTNFHIVQ